MGMFLRRGLPAKKIVELDIVLSGSLESSMAYITVNGAKYYTAQTLTVQAGTTVSVLAGYMRGRDGPKTAITFDGVEVARGVTNVAAEYSFEIKNSVHIVFTEEYGYNTYYTCAITTVT
jgi:hypothetical protein